MRQIAGASSLACRLYLPALPTCRALRHTGTRPQDIRVRGLPPADFAHCGHLVSGHPFAADAVVSGHLSGETGLSALALKRQLGVSYPTAWMIQHKLMRAMAERDNAYPLSGTVQVDDAYLGGERSGGKAGRGSENKVPFVAAVALDEQNHPRYIKLTPVPGFTLKAIADWAQTYLNPGCSVISDGLACFGGVKDAGCQHQPIVAGGKKPRDMPEFNWINTLLGNVKTSLSGAYHAFDFGKYAVRYLAAIAYRFNRRFRLDMLPGRLLVAAIACAPRPESWLRGKTEEAC
jgi:hypothetical protein